MLKPVQIGQEVYTVQAFSIDRYNLGHSGIVVAKAVQSLCVPLSSFKVIKSSNHWDLSPVLPFHSQSRLNSKICLCLHEEVVRNHEGERSATEVQKLVLYRSSRGSYFKPVLNQCGCQLLIEQHLLI